MNPTLSLLRMSMLPLCIENINLVKARIKTMKVLLGIVETYLFVMDHMNLNLFNGGAVFLNLLSKSLNFYLIAKNSSSLDLEKIYFLLLPFSKQVSKSRADAEKEGIKIPSTVEEYCIKHQPIGSSSDNIDLCGDDWYDDDDYEDDDDDEDNNYSDNDDSGNADD